MRRKWKYRYYLQSDLQIFFLNLTLLTIRLFPTGLDELKKGMKNQMQDIRSSDRDLNPELSKFVAELLNT